MSRTCVAHKAFQIVLEDFRSSDPHGLWVNDHHSVAIRQGQHVFANFDSIHIGVIIRRKRRHVVDGAKEPRILSRRVRLEKEQPVANCPCLHRVVEELGLHHSVCRVHSGPVDPESLHLAEAVKESDKFSVAHVELPDARNDKVAFDVFRKGSLCSHRAVCKLLQSILKQQVVANIILDFRCCCFSGLKAMRVLSVFSECILHK
mmetsp:Transcript_25406/g.46105  ORF Transcript_25406/g.46105 Transcript_25406/m.46105 type:complete len:204 (+) Transcript_25406:1221-1832(+)